MHKKKLMLKNKKNKTVGILGLGSIGLRHAKKLFENLIVFGYDKCEKKEMQNMVLKFYRKKSFIRNYKRILLYAPSSLHHDDLKFLLKKAKKNIG